MLDSLLDKIVGITLGIRYSKSFRIPDISGEIIDDILYNNHSPFGANYFPLLDGLSTGEKRLWNEETGNQLIINTNDLILRTKIDNFSNNFNQINKKFLPYLIERIFLQYNIQNINRIGIIFHHILPETEKIKKIATEFSDNNITMVNDIKFYFSQKIPTLNGQIKKGTKDYLNTIYTFVQRDDKLFADLDYQHYYIPDVSNIKDCNPEKFISGAKEFLVDKFYNWLKNYAKKD